jgi:hypothetical protein
VLPRLPSNEKNSSDHHNSYNKGPNLASFSFTESPSNSLLTIKFPKNHITSSYHRYLPKTANDIFVRQRALGVKVKLQGLMCALCLNVKCSVLWLQLSWNVQYKFEIERRLIKRTLENVELHFHHSLSSSSETTVCSESSSYAHTVPVAFRRNLYRCRNNLSVKERLMPIILLRIHPTSLTKCIHRLIFVKTIHVILPA